MLLPEEFCSLDQLNNLPLVTRLESRKSVSEKQEALLQGSFVIQPDTRFQELSVTWTEEEEKRRDQG